jgi:hypothetical protein
LRSIKLKGENVGVSSMQDDVESKGVELSKQRRRWISNLKWERERLHQMVW